MLLSTNSYLLEAIMRYDLYLIDVEEEKSKHKSILIDMHDKSSGLEKFIISMFLNKIGIKTEETKKCELFNSYSNIELSTIFNRISPYFIDGENDVINSKMIMFIDIIMSVTSNTEDKSIYRNVSYYLYKTGHYERAISLAIDFIYFTNTDILIIKTLEFLNGAITKSKMPMHNAQEIMEAIIDKVKERETCDIESVKYLFVYLQKQGKYDQIMDVFNKFINKKRKNRKDYETLIISVDKIIPLKLKEHRKTIEIFKKIIQSKFFIFKKIDIESTINFYMFCYFNNIEEEFVNFINEEEWRFNEEEKERIRKIKES